MLQSTQSSLNTHFTGLHLIMDSLYTNPSQATIQLQPSFLPIVNYLLLVTSQRQLQLRPQNQPQLPRQLQQLLRHLKHTQNLPQLTFNLHLSTRPLHSPTNLLSFIRPHPHITNLRTKSQLMTPLPSITSNISLLMIMLNSLSAKLKDVTGMLPLVSTASFSLIVELK